MGVQLFHLDSPPHQKRHPPDLARVQRRRILLPAAPIRSLQLGPRNQHRHGLLVRPVIATTLVVVVPASALPPLSSLLSLRSEREVILIRVRGGDAAGEEVGRLEDGGQREGVLLVWRGPIVSPGERAGPPQAPEFPAQRTEPKLTVCVDNLEHDPVPRRQIPGWILARGLLAREARPAERLDVEHAMEARYVLGWGDIHVRLFSFSRVSGSVCSCSVCVNWFSLSEAGGQ